MLMFGFQFSIIVNGIAYTLAIWPFEWHIRYIANDDWPILRCLQFGPFQIQVSPAAQARPK